ncbi:hypothetical protein BDV96DRAFT_578601 [Lophiotrema nucula]|uniref:Uncharacterized protein n=1 Tax=Lophiotrema nucula TaxID=690887 RepID=A0A6A5Z1E0_9PLEO|nr:hypothetical protein BDV96DRAFT_578601 [Lophiotrema nucula]
MHTNPSNINRHSYQKGYFDTYIHFNPSPERSCHLPSLSTVLAPDSQQPETFLLTTH